MPPRKKPFASLLAITPRVEWRNVSRGRSLIYSVSDNLALVTANPDLAGHSVVFLKPETSEAAASALIEKLDTVSQSGDTAGWGGREGLNIEGQTLPYLVVKGSAAEVKALLEEAELVPHPHLWAGVEQGASAGYTRRDKGPPPHSGPHPRGIN